MTCTLCGPRESVTCPVEGALGGLCRLLPAPHLVSRLALTLPIRN